MQEYNDDDFVSYSETNMKTKMKPIRFIVFRVYFQSNPIINKHTHNKQTV